MVSLWLMLAVIVTRHGHWQFHRKNLVAVVKISIKMPIKSEYGHLLAVYASPGPVCRAISLYIQRVNWRLCSDMPSRELLFLKKKPKKKQWRTQESGVEGVGGLLNLFRKILPPKGLMVFFFKRGEGRTQQPPPRMPLNSSEPRWWVILEVPIFWFGLSLFCSHTKWEREFIYLEGKKRKKKILVDL